LGYSAVVQQLCAHYPNLVSLQDRKGNCALHLAVMGNHQQTVQALLQAAAPINSVNLVGLLSSLDLRL
jgi:ankyrin repeat protein